VRVLRDGIMHPIKDVAAVHGKGILDHARNITKRYGVSTGFNSLDAFLRGGGLLPGLLYSIGARPGMGKTNLLLNIAKSIAETGTPTAFFSLELSMERVLERLAYMESGIDYMQHWRDKQPLTDAEIKLLTTSIQRLQKLPIYVRDTPRLTASDIKDSLTRESHLGCKVALIDYLHILKSETKTFNREREVGKSVESIRDYAKELGIACVLACQLNRQVEESPPFTPALHSFRDTGTIEQVSFMVWALYRQDYYSQAGMLKDEDGIVPALNHKLDVMILKNQDGPTGVVKLDFQGETGRIKDEVV